MIYITYKTIIYMYIYTKRDRERDSPIDRDLQRQIKKERVREGKMCVS